MKTSTRENITSEKHKKSVELTRLIKQYGCGPVRFTGASDALYERHLLFDNVRDLTAVGARERFEAAARSVRDVLPAGRPAQAAVRSRCASGLF
jgi:hypothetical protein